MTDLVELLTHCPICEQTLTVQKLHCESCHTIIENNFSLSRLMTLSKEQLHFVETFLLCRGNIKEMEKKLQISYPTVRNRLDAIVESLADTHTHDVLTDIQNKKIDADEGIEQIRTWKEEK